MRSFLLTFLVLGIASLACAIPYSGGSNPEDMYAWNYPAAIDSGGVVIQIGRVLIANKTAFPPEEFDMQYFADKPVLVEVVFIIKNNSGITMNVFPDQGYVVVGGEQIDLREVSLLATGDTLGGLILPGITKVGTLWFGLRRTALEDVRRLEIVISAPFDNDYNTYGSEYLFEIDLSERKFEALPDELK